MRVILNITIQAYETEGISNKQVQKRINFEIGFYMSKFIREIHVGDDYSWLGMEIILLRDGVNVERR